MVDSIEYCVNQTSDHVGQARGELIKAEEYRSKARKVKKERQTPNTVIERTRVETGQICFSRNIEERRNLSVARKQISRVSNQLDRNMNAANSLNTVLNFEREVRSILPLKVIFEKTRPFFLFFFFFDFSSVRRHREFCEIIISLESIEVVVFPRELTQRIY